MRSFSLIICTYQRPQALVTLLKSVEKQRLYPDEILVIDASLDDQTAEVLNQKAIPKLKYFKVEEQDRGLTRQRNFGIEKLNPQSEIVCFLDDDVILEPDYFEQILRTFHEKPNAVGVGGYITNEVAWEFDQNEPRKDWFVFDGYQRKEGSRFQLRALFGLEPDAAPGFMPDFGHGRSISFLPPSGKIYPVEQLMGGVAAYKTSLFKHLNFSNYFEGYSLYEDADFSLRASKLESLWINTKARLEHHHNPAGRPDLFKYGKMVIRNGWYVWRVKYPSPNLKARFKWNATALVLTMIRFSNVITAEDKKGAFKEAAGRVAGWWSLLFNKPKRR
ncbi:GT2 family glycosyltransferase [Leeuwenhoekiella aestuarii]|uniref:GT2 family glycosyltransferase n=1 Tax=Leeuwenhoekiella aestuarii TaxID=2249426 RepID=A0A4V1KNV6_9FLAO|nr:glycosyltransferase family 2 protein [Leeuwenhoekiella aestuarii]RXG12319.1 GT2 family glycosyltransferase [Leeuwenhoekiella aestuarii]RXG13752.1 GT2 family glycosyltransferase [Leeuwenhoekiella aestuarii]